MLKCNLFLSQSCTFSIITPVFSVTWSLLLICVHKMSLTCECVFCVCVRDTVVHLQQENKTLCVQESSYRHRLEELQTQLEDSQRYQNTLETQNRSVCLCVMCVRYISVWVWRALSLSLCVRLSQQQISELSAQVEELQRALQEQDSKTEDVSNTHIHRKLIPRIMIVSELKSLRSVHKHSVLLSDGRSASFKAESTLLLLRTIHQWH